ncbi:MAG: alpha/beta hydrolase, partial [Phycisphaerales bacterium]
MSMCLPLVLTAVIGISTINGAGFDDPSNGGAYGTRATTGYADVDGGKLYYEVAGEGPTVVLIHDGLLHRVAWDEQFQPFARKYRVIRYDRRGFGLSKTPARAYSNVEDLRALLKHADVGAATLVGSSSGGGLAIDFALAYRDMVDGLVLVGAVVRGFGYSEHFIERSRANRGRDLETTIEHWASDPWTIAPGNSAARRRVHELLLANPQNLSVDKHRYMTPPNQPALGRLSEIRVPTLIVGAEADIPDVHAHAGAIQAGIAGARRVVIPGAGHLVYLERPEEFNGVVLDFLS